MDWQTILQNLDRIVNQQTGKHLTDLQAAILQGVLNGQRYVTIAQQYGCTIGHIKDTSYKLWQILSLALGESVHKTNIRATLERQGLKPPHHLPEQERSPTPR